LKTRLFQCLATKTRLLLCASVFVLFFSIAAARAEAWRVNRTFVAATDSHVYVVGASRPKDNALPEVRFWVVEREKALTGTPPSSTYRLEPVLGEIGFALADAEVLRLLYSDLSLFRYHLENGAATDALFSQQSDLPPLAVAGDRTTRTCWFLVETDGLLSPSSTTKPTTSAPTDDRRPQSRLSLLELKDGFWNRLSVPDDLTSEGKAFTLAARDGRVALIVSGDQSPLRFASFAGDEWSDIATIPNTVDTTSLCASLDEDRQLTVVIASETAANKSDATTTFERIRIAQQTADGWNITSPLRDGSELLQLAGNSSGYALVNDRLALTRARDDGRIDFVMAPLTNDAVARFAPLSNNQEQKIGDEATTGEFLRTLIALGILTVVWSSRRNDILRRANLPDGFMPAPIWKRGIGALIDLAIPFAAWFLLLKWQDPKLFLELFDEPSGDPTLSERFESWWIALVVLYGLNCFVWEALGHASMGKRVLNCRILSVDGSAATGRQLLVRNLVRVLVLSLQTPGIVATVMMMMLFTRNNQRIGDLAANTVVVHPIPKWMEEMDLYPPDQDDD